MNKRMMNEKDAAAYLGMSVKWLQQGRCKNFGPSYVKLGKAVRYAQAELDRYVENRTVNPTA